MTVEERDPERGLRELAREVPLSGISAEVSAGLARGITIIAGPRDGEWTHRIDAPIRLRVNRTPEGADEGIEAESAGGSSTRVRFRSAAFPETVDGLVFGIAAGLGFSLAETLINFATTLQYLGHVAPANWIYPLTTISVLSPLMQGSATGMIVAAVWRQRLGKLGGREIGAVAMAVVAHIAFTGGSQILSDVSLSPLLILIWQAAVVGAMLIYVRYLLHHALLEEAAHMGFAETVCPSCHMHIVASGFCPNCGMALTAAPTHLKRSRRERKEPTRRGA